MLAQRVCDWPHTLRTLSSLTDPTRTLSSLTSYKITSLTSQQHTFILPELVYAPVHFMFAKFWSFVAVLLGFFRLFSLMPQWKGSLPVFVFGQFAAKVPSCSPMWSDLVALLEPDDLDIDWLLNFQQKHWGGKQDGGKSSQFWRWWSVLDLPGSPL